MRVGQEDLRPDQDIVRPGTSAALTARAIDATPPPPLAQAQEAVTTALPRLVEAVPPPLLGASLGLTLLLAMTVSQRVRLRMAPVVMSGLLLMPVSNYHEAQEPRAQTVEKVASDGREPDVESEWQDKPQREEVPDWYNRRIRDEEPERDDARSFRNYSLPRFELVVPEELVEGAMPLIQMVVPDDWSREDAERFLRRNTHRLRREIRRFREQQELEVRGRAYSMEYHHR